MGAKPDMTTITLNKADMHDLSAVEKLSAIGNDNPILVCDQSDFRASTAAYKAIADMIKKLDEEDVISEDDKKELMSILYRIYSERKADTFLKNRFHYIAKTMRQMIDFTTSKASLSNPNKEASLFYYNSIRHTLKNE